MTADFLRYLMSQRPSRPCRLVLTGGHEVPVPSPGAITVPDEDTAEVVPGDGYRHVIDLRHVIEVRS